MACNICGGTEFGNQGKRVAVRCLSCNSLERTRLLWMHLQRLPLSASSRILHIAPEVGLSKKLAAIAGENYVPADFFPNLYPYAPNCRKIDLCDLDAWPSREFDLILHSHVLEHTPCYVAYTMFHLHRMLKDDGTHLCVIPFMPGRYDETFQDIPLDERMRRFGQNDHVRRYGNADVDLHVGKVVKFPEQHEAAMLFTPEELDSAHIPVSERTGLHGSTVLVLKRNDMKMIQGG